MEKKQIQMMEVQKIKPHPSNETIYLTADVTDLKKSMQRMQEMLEPILLTKLGIILSGHRRYKAALELGWEHVPVRIVDIPEEQQIIYLIAANSYREKTWGEKAAEIEAIHRYAETYGKEALLKFLDKESSELTLRQQVAEVVGLCEVYVSRLQKIAEIDPQYIAMVDAGEVTFNKAYNACVKGKSAVPQPKASKKPEKKFFCSNCPKNK